MSLKIGVVMDPIATIKPEKDSTLALMLAARKMGATLFYMVIEGLYVEGGAAFAIAHEIDVTDSPENWYQMGPAHHIPLKSLDIILMRKDPPVDKPFQHACAILDLAQKDGVRVMNNPVALMTFNEKIFATHFPSLCPPTVIASDFTTLQNFREQQGAIIVKPLDSMGGDGVFMIEPDDVNFEVICEIHTQRGTHPVVAQKFLPAIADGDKRVIVVNGKPFDRVLVRTPKAGSIRGNIAAGGSTKVESISTREREIAETVGAVLVRHGIVFAGLDIIGDQLIEINITSPTGLRQISKSSEQDVAAFILNSVVHGNG